MLTISLKKLLTILAIALFAAAAIGACNWDSSNASRSMAETPGLIEIGKAAEQGNADAQYNLGMAYLIGRGVARDGRQAKALFLKAAEQGYSPAHANMEWSYARNKGFSRKEQESSAPGHKAAEPVSKLAQN